MKPERAAVERAATRATHAYRRRRRQMELRSERRLRKFRRLALDDQYDHRLQHVVD